MTQQLADLRILVTDDQIDVARTLCRPLHKSGARLHWATDGNTALQKIATYPFDLILIDMKMPPDEWGGLWLLQQLKDGGWRIPSLVLSGEGSKQQVVEALRLDATNWVDKDNAGEELLEQCSTTLSDRLRESLEFVSHSLPTPLAHRFSRYSRITDPDKKFIEGLHTLETILRFTAVLGLSSASPTPLRGIRPDQLTAPSMGTWFALCVALADLPDTGDEFTRMFSWLVPERSNHQQVQGLISARNDLMHGRDTPTPAQADQLDGLLRRFAHRAASSWRADLAVPISMTYDGTVYSIDVLNLRGAGKPAPGKAIFQDPIVTQQPFLISRDSNPLPLSPWLLTHTELNTGTVRCLQFDGLQHAKRDRAPSTPFKYAKADEGNEVPTISHPQARWQTLSQWTTAPASSTS
ncbi:response regulator [Streptomonospora nanhaiensis]|uniref:Response regulator n=1 Tax=Streptomonospora nanhaiensis TaxID=1323731 RepID=A0ABY6YU05_9ACTN|nr:response regulator [Streptomonospora nanhaiensis]WAE75584.1 response regulator [Streptomonospora nanhaiensis]